MAAFPDLYDVWYLTPKAPGIGIDKGPKLFVP